ncbi:uncharacterized protein LOC129723758 isoform X3 [Wyeomyia smithii]|uniref:uncharacterized protein LOC129723758 isoform X3 n=2 Tax=Wyeomyia smithii TaxID=174621 RepID=UPI002467D149|nr:uncharacterized protein LOC129723758 isoform X3 [Wyeomyia smithii]
MPATPVVVVSLPDSRQTPSSQGKLARLYDKLMTKLDQDSKDKFAVNLATDLGIDSSLRYLKTHKYIHYSEVNFNGNVNKLCKKETTENGVTMESLLLMVENDLKSMGIIKKGPTVLILDFINTSKACLAEDENVQESLEPDIASTTLTDNELESILEQHPRFHGIYVKKLAPNGTLQHGELLLMTRILCDHFYGRRIWEDQNYPTHFEKKMLAERIVRAYPQLGKPVSCGAPLESVFFL